MIQEESPERARAALANACKTKDDETVLSSLRVLCEWAAKIACEDASQENEGLFDKVARTVVDWGAPWLAQVATDRAAAEEVFHRLFLHGPPATSFSALNDALSQGSPEAAEECCRALLLFTSRGLSGVSRMTRVFLKPEDYSVAAVVHLPSKIANSMLYTQGARGKAMNDSTRYPFDEKGYVGLVTEAALDAWTSLDQVEASEEQTMKTRRQLQAVIARLCRLSFAPQIVDAWCELAGTRSLIRAAELIVEVEPSAVCGLVRGLLETRVVEEEAVGDALRFVLSRNRVAYDYCTTQVPVQYPLLRPARDSARRLVRAVFATGAGWDGAYCAAQMWSGDTFAVSQDLGLQHQATRVVLLYANGVKRSARTDESESHAAHTTELAATLAAGVSLRLGTIDERLRRCGMVVGEALSRLQSVTEPLQFERSRPNRPVDESADDEADSTASDLSDLATMESSSEQYRVATVNIRSPRHVPANAPTVGVAQSVGAAQGVPHALSEAHALWWVDEDDWSSLESFDYTSDNSTSGDPTSEGSGLDVHVSEKDYEAVRAQIAAPMSLNRVLSVLERYADGDERLRVEPEVVLATLRTIHARAVDMARTRGRTGGADAFREAAPEVCLAVLRIDGQSAPPQLANDLNDVREAVLRAIARMDVLRVGLKLINDVFGGATADVRRREDAVRILAQAVHDLSDNEAQDGLSDRVTENSDEKAAVPQQRVGTETRRNHAALAVRARRADSAATTRSDAVSFLRSGAPETLFYALANVLERDGGADFVSFADRDAPLAGHALATMALLVSRSGADVRESLGIALAEVSGAWRSSECAPVRRAVALCGGAVARAIGVSPQSRSTMGASAAALLAARDDETGVGAGAIAQLVAWLRRVADGADPDVYVRRFARQALSAWVERIESA